MKQGSECRYYVAKIDISSERERVRGKLNVDEREDIHIQVFDLSDTLKRGLNLGFVTLLTSVRGAMMFMNEVNCKWYEREKGGLVDQVHELIIGHFSSFSAPPL